MSRGWTLVTGASGFVGSRLVRELVDRGERVKAFVRAGSSLRQLQGLPPDRFRLAYGDIVVEHTVYRALSDCDRLYHVASNFKFWDKNPDRILKPAEDGTRATLQAARKRNIEKIVVTSSTASLGATSAAEPMDEEHEFNLSDPEIYTKAKFEAEQIALTMAEEGMPIVVVLPSGIAGPGDWKPTPTGEAILRYLKSPPTFRMPVPAGGINIVDVEDVVNGHILAMEKGVSGERFILGGENLTFSQMITTLSELTALAPPGGNIGGGLLELGGRLMELSARLFGGEPALTYRMARDYASSYVWVTSEKAEQQLGYTHRPARETLLRSVKWFLEHGYVPERAASRVHLELNPA